MLCPKCNTLYKETDCIQTSSTGIKQSKRCNFVMYPHHQNASKRKACETELMKSVTVNGKIKPIPRKHNLCTTV